jgi:HD-GYP domain-containing protein (c-di-GMP phosphodiesterase class II)
MEIWLNCAWYKHPFPKNRFRLRSAKQITTIREFNLNTVHYHPASYRPTPESEPQPDPGGDASSPDGLESIPSEWVDTSIVQTPCQEVSSSTLRSELRQANHAYRDTLRKSSDCLRQLCAGQEAGSNSASSLVQNLLDQIVKSETSVTLGDVLHLKVLERAQAAHGLHCCILSLLVGRELELEPQELRVLGMAALLHDLGEQRLPSQIRFKTEALTRAEKSLFELHPLYGKEMLDQLLRIPRGVADIVAQHHEYLNGTGYPRRLTEEQILPLAKIIRVVDEYQYLTTPREARLRLHPNQALSELYVKRQKQLSVKVIIALIRVISVYPPGTLLELSDGSIGIVLYTNARARLRPAVMAYEERGSELESRLVDLNAQREISIRRVMAPEEMPPHLLDHMMPAEALNCLLEQTVATKTPARNKNHQVTDRTSMG